MKFLTILLILSCVQFNLAQEYSYIESKVNPLQADRFVGRDNYDNTYTIIDRTLYKKGASGDHQFTALSIGGITTVDIINPLKITLFYQNSNVAVILDNTLSEILRIDFNAIEAFRNVSHATTATDRRLWIFNTDLQQLELFDYNLLKVIISFQPVSELPKLQISNFNLCYMVIGNELYIYNIYGALLERRKIPVFDDIKQHNDNLIALNADGLFYKAATASQFSPVSSLKNDIKDFHLIDEILYIYNGQELSSGRLKPTKN